MKLLYQTHSPYARKVLVAAFETGLADRLEVIHHETSPTRRNEEVYRLNPLGKVPVLICDDGLALFDSSVICEYLDGLHERQNLFPVSGQKRLRALRLQALAHGIADAGIAVRWEIERRPEHLRWPELRAAQMQKIEAACDFIEQGSDLEEPLNIGQIALATMLGWIAFRNIYPFAENRPRLASWYNKFSLRPSMAATPLSGETQD